MFRRSCPQYSCPQYSCPQANIIDLYRNVIPTNKDFLITYTYNKHIFEEEKTNAIDKHENCKLEHNSCIEDDDYIEHSAYLCQKDNTIIYIKGCHHYGFSMTDFDFNIMEKADLLFSESKIIPHTEYHNYGSSESFICRSFKHMGKPIYFIDTSTNEDPILANKINEWQMKVKNHNEITIKSPQILSNLSLPLRNNYRELLKFNLSNYPFDNLDELYWVINYRNIMWKINYIDKYSTNKICFMTCGGSHVYGVVKMLEEDGFVVKPLPESDDICLPSNWYIGI